MFEYYAYSISPGQAAAHGGHAMLSGGHVVLLNNHMSHTGWRGWLKILLERVLDQKHRIERGFPSIFDHYRHHSYTGDG